MKMQYREANFLTQGEVAAADGEGNSGDGRPGESEGRGVG